MNTLDEPRKTVRTVSVTRHGPPEVLQIRERPEIFPGPFQIGIEVRAAGVNFSDVMARMGLYPAAPRPPFVIGYEVSGIVTALGEGVTRFRVGDRVMAFTRFGGYAEQIAAHENDAMPLADELSFEEGAALPLNYATAATALLRYGNLQPGERVLVHSGAGGVGIAAIQIACHAGAEVWAAASPGKREALEGQGAHQVVNYRAAKWDRSLPLFDLILDPIGGHSCRIDYRLLRPGGRLVVYGAAALVSGEQRNPFTAVRTLLATPWFNPIALTRSAKSIIGMSMLTLFDEFGEFSRWFEPARQVIDKGARPVIASALPLSDAAEAHRQLASRRTIGKIVLVP